jgi:hypothetical protein
VKIGIISDTHGLLRPQVFGVFQGVEHILHAGDIGNVDIITELEAIAPVTAIWGNADGLEVRGRVPEMAEVELGGVRVAVIHGMQVGSPTPEKIAALYPGAGLAVFGHSHRPLIKQVGPTLAVNPGSAGRRRFRDPVTVALAEILAGSVTARLVELDLEKR